MKTKMMSYNEAKEYLKPLKLKSKADYAAWWNKNKPDFLPEFPEQYYGSEPKEKKDNPAKRTIDEVLADILEIIANTMWVQTRLSQLKARGYQIEDCWVKNGSIEAMWYMRRKKVLRIQVTDSEPSGMFHKASCVVIPASEVLFQEGDAARVRHYPNASEAKSITNTIVENRNLDNK